MNYKVIKIEEDMDFGCEERPDNQPVMAVVTLQDEEGNLRSRKVPDAYLYEKNINEMDEVMVDEDGNLLKR